MRTDGYVYFRIERKNRNGHKHKLAPVVERSFKVKDAYTLVVTIEKVDRSVESCFALTRFHRTEPVPRKEDEGEASTDQVTLEQ